MRRISAYASLQQESAEIHKVQPILFFRGIMGVICRTDLERLYRSLLFSNTAPRSSGKWLEDSLPILIIHRIVKPPCRVEAFGIEEITGCVVGYPLIDTHSRLKHRIIKISYASSLLSGPWTRWASRGLRSLAQSILQPSRRLLELCAE